LTTHSPIGLNPEKFGVTPILAEITFANNDIDFTDITGIDHSKFSFGLKKSLYNYLHGIGFELPLQDWFDFKVPKTTIGRYFIEDCLTTETFVQAKPSSIIVWLGSRPIVEEVSKTKRGETWFNLQCTFHEKTDTYQVTFQREQGLWLLDQFEELAPSQVKPITLAELKTNFESHFEDFELFWISKPMLRLRKSGLLVL